MKKWAYYNDNDPYVCEWARNLIKAGLVADGVVDERSISEVTADDVKEFKECHFFCGILGWPLALQLAGWEGPVWTGSCPCQPLSSAGQQKGHADERHLWPSFYRLLAECRPSTVFGEQVASKLGREWLAGVRADLEQLGYAVGCADMPAASVGAPHIRQRLWWLADANQGQRGRLADGEGCQRNGTQAGRLESDREPESGGAIGGLDDADGRGRPARRHGLEAAGHGRTALPDDDVGGLEIPERIGRRGWDNGYPPRDTCADQAQGSGGGFWSDFDIIPCGDGKARRVEPKYVALAPGVPGGLVPGRTENENEEEINAAPKIDRDGGGSLRIVREVEMQAARSSQGRESEQQRIEQLADLVRLLPSSCALAELHGDATTSGALSALRQAIAAEGLLRDTPEQIETAWRSLPREARQCIWDTISQAGIVRTPEHPLAHGIPNRVGKLRAYGNAINPEIAAEFIRAYRGVKAP